jgi:eukaryotic-like serine/threonine-protein kinase
MSETMPAPGAAASAEDLLGQLVDGRYLFEAQLGSGGMGTVYRARHVGLERNVAIKVLRPQLASQDQWLRRFMQEARAASRIRHVNVVETLDFGTLPDGAAYCVMELLEGFDLAQLVSRLGCVPWPRARSILIQMVRGLGAAHACGVIHRDVKPANCFLVDAFAAGRVADAAGGPDLVKMLDFGIAKVVGDDRGDLTATNELIGTAAYMAPERAARGVADVRADIYAVGIVAYKMLTGVVPFRGETMFATLTQHVQMPPPSIRARVPSIPPMVEDVVFKALAKHPDHRYQTMADLEAALCSVADADHATVVSASGPFAAVPLAPPGGAVITSSSMDHDSATEVDSRLSALTESHELPLPGRPWSQRPVLVGAFGAAFALGLAGAIALGAGLGADAQRDPAPGDTPIHSAERPGGASVARSPEQRPDPARSVSPAGPSSEAGPARDDPEPVAPLAEPPAEASAAEPVNADAPASAGSQDDAPSGSASEASPRSTPRRPKAKPTPPETDASVLDRLRRRARSQCSESAESTTVVVKFSILSSGKTSLPRANPPHEHSAVGSCVVSLVRGAKFPEDRMRATELKIKF